MVTLSGPMSSHSNGVDWLCTRGGILRAVGDTVRRALEIDNTEDIVTFAFRRLVL